MVAALQYWVGPIVVLVMAAAILAAIMLYSMKSAVTPEGSVTFSGFDGVGVVLTFVAFIIAAAGLGSGVAGALIASVLIHEAGHVLAHRMLGHGNVRFRMIPIKDRGEISDTKVDDEGEAFFIALMGPGFSLVPMFLAMAMASALATSAPHAAANLQIFAVTCAAFNFVNLLPFFPLDGGRCARIATANFWPMLAPAMTVFMSAAMFTAGLRTGSIALLILAVAGAQTLMRHSPTIGKPMGPDNALIGLAAYAFTMAAHFTAGWMLIDIYI